MKMTVTQIVINALGTILKGLIKGLEYMSITLYKISQNTEKSPRDSRRVAVTQTSVRNHELMLM